MMKLRSLSRVFALCTVGIQVYPFYELLYITFIIFGYEEAFCISSCKILQLSVIYKNFKFYFKFYFWC